MLLLNNLSELFYVSVLSMDINSFTRKFLISENFKNQWFGSIFRTKPPYLNLKCEKSFASHWTLKPHL